MTTLKHTCDNCDTAFRIAYDEELAADEPKFCPFCAELMCDNIEDQDELDL